MHWKLTVSSVPVLVFAWKAHVVTTLGLKATTPQPAALQSPRVTPAAPFTTWRTLLLYLSSLS
jgi:hypothetical protein